MAEMLYWFSEYFPFLPIYLLRNLPDARQISTIMPARMEFKFDGDFRTRMWILWTLRFAIFIGFFQYLRYVKMFVEVQKHDFWFLHMCGLILWQNRGLNHPPLKHCGIIIVPTKTMQKVLHTFKSCSRCVGDVQW